MPQAPIPVDPFRPVEPCAVPEAPVPDEFFTPAQPPLPPTPLPTVAPVLCGPDGMTVTCADLVNDPDYTGPSVTLPPEDLDKRPFYWQMIPGITENQLAYIASLLDVTRDQVAEVTFNSAGLVTATLLSAVEIAEIFQLLPSQANFTRSLVSQMSQGAWSINRNRALSRLTCAFYNDEQTVSCGAGAVDTYLGRSFTTTATIAAGSVPSQISKADANEQATALAASQLDCLWVNQEVTRKCSQQAGMNVTQVADYQAVELVGDSTTFLVGRPEEITRVVAVTIPAGVLSSSDGQAQADALAAAEADLGLNCFFTAPATADCPNDVDDIPADSPAADVYNQTPGSAVDVPEGLVTTTVSQAQAAADAQTFANSLLECYWLNTRQEVLCADAFGGVIVDGPDGNPVTVTISDRSSTFLDAGDVLQYGALVEAAEVRSDTSRADANSQALVIGLSRTVCIYCNGPVPPFCVPAPLWSDLAPEDRPPLPLIPSDYEADAENGPEWWSVDATLGVPAGRFCLENDPPGAQSIANTTGTIPFQGVDVGVDCVYENDALTYSCAEAIGAGNPSAPYLSPRSSAPVSIASGLVFARLSTTPIDWMVGEPDHQRVKAYANELARLTALSILDCFYESPNLAIYCGAATGAALPAAANWTDLGAAPSPIGNGRAGVSNDFVSREATGFLTDDLVGPPGTPRPVLLPYGSGQSSVSPREALDKAILIGQSLLDCFFKEAGVAECVPKPDMRLRHIDNGINGWDIPYDGLDGVPFVCDGGPGYGWYVNSIDKGQTARFLYSGLQLPGALTAVTNPPGQTVPTAIEVAISYVSKADAIQQAESLARGRLDCTHTNWYRDNTYCPQGTRLAAEGKVCRDAIQADSTEMANTQAEWESQGRTICIPVGPFNLGVRPQSNGGVQWKIQPGGVVTFPHSKLECSNDVEPGTVIKELYWEDCAGPLVGDTWRNLANGEWLFFVFAECCSGTLKYILKVFADDGSDGDIREPGFYPELQLAALRAANPTKVIWYLGSVISEPEPGSGVLAPIQSSYEVHQHVDNQLMLFDGGNDQRFKPIQNPNGSLSFLPGAVTFYTGRTGKYTPHFPIWNGGAINAHPAPEGGIGTGSRKIWIRISETGSELFNKDAADTGFDDEGKMWILLSSFTVVGGVMTDLNHIHRSDIIVGCCEGTTIDGSSTGSSSDPGSTSDPSSGSYGSGSDPGSSGGGSSGDPHADCEGDPYATLARNGTWGDCRNRPPYQPDRYLMDFSWDVSVTAICTECPTWFARLTITSPSADITAFGGTDIGEHVRNGNSVHWIFAKPFGDTVCITTGFAQFANDPYEPCAPVTGTIEVYGTPPDAGVHPCCGFWPPQTFNLGLTPPYCEDGPCETTGPP